MTRPVLHSSLTSSEFEKWYWLKEELIVFCREHKLRTTGSKPEIAARIAAFLEGKVHNEKQVTKRVQAEMPLTFALGTKIDEGWRCNPRLGAFLKLHCGKSFRFNAATREFIHTQAGATLAQAIACYKRSTAPDAPKPEIIAQNEYNRHTRAYYAQHPNATREEVIAAWWQKRNKARG